MTKRQESESRGNDKKNKKQYDEERQRMKEEMKKGKNKKNEVNFQMVGFGGYENDFGAGEEIEKKKPAPKKKVPSKPPAPRPEWVDVH